LKLNGRDIFGELFSKFSENVSPIKYLTGETFSENFFREGNFLILLPRNFSPKKALRKDRSIFDAKIEPATGVIAVYTPLTVFVSRAAARGGWLVQTPARGVEPPWYWRCDSALELFQCGDPK